MTAGGASKRTVDWLILVYLNLIRSRGIEQIVNTKQALPSALSLDAVQQVRAGLQPQSCSSFSSCLRQEALLPQSYDKHNYVHMHAVELVYVSFALHGHGIKTRSMRVIRHA